MSQVKDCLTREPQQVSEDISSLQRYASGLGEYLEIHRCDELKDIRLRWPLLDIQAPYADIPPAHGADGHNPRIVLVTGVAGGVGATTVVANLASVLQHLGQKVAVVDLSPGQDLHLHLGGGDQAAYPPDGNTGEGQSSLQLLRPDDAAADQEITAQWLSDSLSALPADSFDSVLIDCPWHRSAVFEQACSMAGRVLMVSSTEPSAVHQLERVFGRFLAKSQSYQLDTRLLINGFNLAVSLQRDLHTLLHSILSARLAPAEIPHDSRVADSLARRGAVCMLYPDCEAARCFVALGNWLKTQDPVSAEAYHG
ncbi:cellulose synthase operon protein YhjQ/BcsQ [Thiolapillus sp.]